MPCDKKPPACETDGAAVALPRNGAKSKSVSDKLVQQSFSTAMQAVGGVSEEERASWLGAQALSEVLSLKLNFIAKIVTDALDAVEQQGTEMIDQLESGKANKRDVDSGTLVLGPRFDIQYLLRVVDRLQKPVKRMRDAERRMRAAEYRRDWGPRDKQEVSRYQYYHGALGV